MNYIKEINSFYDWLETNSVSDSAINLWHGLLHVNNKASNNAEWKSEFSVAISTLMVKTSLSKSSIIRARNQLKQLGRIDFRERKGNQSAIYKIVAFHTDTQIETQIETQSGTQSGTQYGTQTDTINKLNLNETNSSFKKEAKEENIIKENSGEVFPETTVEVNPESEEKEKSSAKKEKGPRSVFRPPSVQEVQDYCNERQNGISGYSFVNFYQSKGWMVGSNKMKDWKAAIRTWEQKNKENGKSNSNNANNGFNSRSGNTTMGTGGKKSASSILAERARQQSAGSGNGGNFTTETEVR